jgi:glycosyltransferase involved in cell wall biosynthesis
MRIGKTAILHYSAPPVIGGVEAVIAAHAGEFARAGLPLAVIAGRGEADALPRGVEFIHIPEIDSQYPEVLRITQLLNAGELPDRFEQLAGRLTAALDPIVRRFDTLIVHNALSKHFNLPLTAALHRLLESGAARRVVAWCHDLSWTSSSSRGLLHPGYPWDLLKTPHPRTAYVAISAQRQEEIHAAFGIPREQIRVIYSGVDPRALLGLSAEGLALSERLGLWEADLILLMPVRVTRAKNIEFALELARALKQRGGLPRLVVSGPPDPHEETGLAYYQELLALRTNLGVEAEFRFVHESGPEPSQPFTLSLETVGELYRLADAVFVPSHREGFGLPVLEAGLIGAPVICTGIPAAQEIAPGEALMFEPDTPADTLAGRILDWLESQPTARLRRRVRRRYTWRAVFENQILPFLKELP